MLKKTSNIPHPQKPKIQSAMAEPIKAKPIMRRTKFGIVYNICANIVFIYQKIDLKFIISTKLSVKI